MNFKTKFSIDDQVYYMSRNKIVKSTVKGVSVFQGQRTLWKGERPSETDKEETKFEGARVIYYTFLDPMGIQEQNVFATRNELLESLSLDSEELELPNNNR